MLTLSDEALEFSAGEFVRKISSDFMVAVGAACAELRPHDEIAETSAGEFMRQISSDIIRTRDREVNQQLEKVSDKNGFFVDIALNSKGEKRKALESYGIESLNTVGLAKLVERVITNECFNGEQVLGAILAEKAMETTLDDKPIALYLWRKKNIVAFINLDCPLMKVDQGAMLLKERPDLDVVLDKVVSLSYFGVKVRSTIKDADSAGINAAVKQQLEWASRICAKGLIPIVQIEVGLVASNRAKCEQKLLNALLDGLENLGEKEACMLELSIPVVPNTYMSLLGHPNVIRMMATSGGTCDRAESCKMLEQNAGLIACFGAGFVEGLKKRQSEEDFSKAMQTSCSALFTASVAMPTKQLQMTKFVDMDGFFVSLCIPPEQPLQAWSIDPRRFVTRREKAKVARFSPIRIITHPKFNGARVLAAVISEEAMLWEVEGMPTARFLWEQKNIVPFLMIDDTLSKGKDCMQLSGKLARFDELLEKASAAGIFGTACQTCVRLATIQGVKTLVDQLFKIARHIMSKGLVAMLSLEVSDELREKQKVELLLLDALIEGLEELRSDEKVVFWLSPPDRPNMYLPLIGHPNTLRVVSRGCTHCKRVKDNIGMIGTFHTCFVEGLTLDTPDDAFTDVLDTTCDALFQVSCRLPPKEEQKSKIHHQDGFFAAFDEDGVSHRNVLLKCGVEEHAFVTDVEEMSRLQKMQTDIIKHPKFNGSRVIGVFINVALMERLVSGIPLPVYLWERKHILSFLLIERGLMPENSGVQQPDDTHDLEDVLDRAVSLGIFGAKMNTLIKRPDDAGIYAAVVRHFALGRRALAKGLIPVMHLEVDIDSPQKAACEAILEQELQRAARCLGLHEELILKLTLPEKPDTYAALLRSSSVVRLLFASDGHSNKGAWMRLKANQSVVSIGRAFIEDMMMNHTDKAFFSRR